MIKFFYSGLNLISQFNQDNMTVFDDQEILDIEASKFVHGLQSLDVASATASIDLVCTSNYRYV